MSSPDPASSADPLRDVDAEARTVAFGAFVGTALEWYDFFLYGTAASLVFNKLFFATKDPLVSTMAAFATFAVGFVARPVGAVIFGRMGDKVGRRRTLLVTVVLIGLVTGCIGLLPTQQQIGVGAPVLLTALRLLQGVAVGGEWGGAVTLAVEHAPPERRGRYAVLPQIGSPIGTLLSSGAFVAVGTLPQEAFLGWGWRIPFLLGFPLLGIAVWIRRRVEESPLFERMLEEDELAATPVRTVFAEALPELLVGAGSTLLGVGGFYLVTTYMISYGTQSLGLDKSLLLQATLWAAAFEILVLVAAGRVVERIGAGRVTLAGGVLAALFAYPLFLLVDTRSPALVLLGIVVGVAFLSIPYAASGPLLAELFPANLRYSGVALSSNLAAVVSGFVPMVATAWFAASGGRSWAPAALLAILALVTAACGVAADARRVGASRRTLRR